MLSIPGMSFVESTVCCCCQKNLSPFGRVFFMMSREAFHEAVALSNINHDLAACRIIGLDPGKDVYCCSFGFILCHE